MVLYAVVIPVFRGEKTIPLLTERIMAFFNRAGYSYEIIFVSDNGPDNSWQVIKALQQQFPEQIKAVKLTRNFGQHNALICGFGHVESDFIFTIDEDLQHQPEDFGKLIAEQARGNFDVVYGKYDKLKHTPLRNLLSKLIKRLMAVSIPDMHPDYTSFRLIKTDIARTTLGMNNSYTVLDGYLSWVTTHCSSTEVKHDFSRAGKSAYTTTKLINHALNVIFTFSVLPIRLVTVLSVIIFLGSVLFSFYLITRKLVFNDLVSGYASTMVLMGMGIGLILFSLGVIGEYIHRINLKTTKKPNFVQSEVLKPKL